MDKSPWCFEPTSMPVLRYSTQAIDIGKRVGDLDVQMLGLALRGRTLVKQARVAEGMGLIDEAMASAVNGQLGAWAAGFVYCNTLSVCQEAADARRATEWTAATRRCNARDAIIPSSGHCRAHRAGILRQHGDWAEAEEDARCGCDELRHGDGLHIDGCSDLILEVFGQDVGQHARSAVGMAELPFGLPVEIEGSWN